MKSSKRLFGKLCFASLVCKGSETFHEKMLPFCLIVIGCFCHVKITLLWFCVLVVGISQHQWPLSSLVLSFFLCLFFFFMSVKSSVSINGWTDTLRVVHLGMCSLTAETNRSVQVLSDLLTSLGKKARSPGVCQSSSLSAGQFALLKL